jgi:hypothetical protein
MDAENSVAAFGSGVLPRTMPLHSLGTPVDRSTNFSDMGGTNLWDWFPAWLRHNGWGYGLRVVPRLQLFTRWK